MEKNRKKPRRRGAQARANADLQSHIESLGLTSASAYQSWCHEHGFTGALNKDWSQRRLERQAAKKSALASASDKVLMEFIGSLGLESVEAYRDWCVAHGLSDSLNKSIDQRRKEVRILSEEKAANALRSLRKTTRHLEEMIVRIAYGETRPEDVFTPLLVLIRDRFAEMADPAGREALLSLLLRVSHGTDLLSADPAIPALGWRPGNTFIEGLKAVASHRADLVRSLEGWKPRSRNPLRQFRSLLRHLFATYEVPSFMDGAWFHDDPREARRQQEWFKLIGAGENIRKADLPLSFTRMMAHVFPKAPQEFTVKQALRWAQAVGMGGSDPLAREIAASRLGESFEHEDFWETVTRFLADQPMIDPACVVPIIDYLQAQKFDFWEMIDAEGATVLSPPPFPDLSMKGRTLAALMERVEEWHARLAKDAAQPVRHWGSTGLQGFEMEEGSESDRRLWTIHELKSSKELAEEGKSMAHCVRSYAQSCANGRISIWSLRLTPSSGAMQRLFTIAVKNDVKLINQVRGKRNSLPTGKAPAGTHQRIRKETQDLMREGWDHVIRWANAEGLKISPQI